ncbi:MAG TPA: histidine kinase dimerization/phospho-acceptor domain-containing protein, partial [Nitrososphaera sp.]|nr:histidine kinase dimerization/phospho-acceptor domain-containing protein [Nitrososphaera sp.]
SAKAGFTIIIAIIVVSYGLFFYLEMAGEFKIREIQFERSTTEQTKLVQNAAHHAEHFISQSLAKLGSMAAVGPEAGDALAAIDTAHYAGLQGGMAVLTDENGMVAWASPDMASYGVQKGSVLAGRSWAGPAQGPAFTGDEISGAHFMVVALPLFQDGRYAGHVAQFITQEAVSHIVTPGGEGPVMQLLDSEGRFVVHPDEGLAGEPFDSDGQAELDALVQGMMAGGSEAKSAVYSSGGDEFLAVVSPVAVEGRPAYFVLVHVPVAVFYQEINEVLTSQRIQSFSILAGTSVSVIILAVFVNRTVSLDREVRKRTKELEESSTTIMQQKKELEQANEELKRLDAAKDEFLDVAAHEIRNPITPIMLAAEELEAQLGRRKDV